MTEAILNYGTSRGFHPRTLERWLKLAEPARSALLKLVQELKMGENHFRDIADWVEEISLRDGVELHDVLGRDTVSRILSDPRLGRSDKLKRLKEELRRIRFPRLAGVEREIHARIRALKLGPRIHLSIPPGLEGGLLTVQVKAGSQPELKRLVAELAQALDKEPMKEIFDFLGNEQI